MLEYSNDVPGAKYGSSKLWPASHFAQVGDADVKGRQGRGIDPRGLPPAQGLGQERLHLAGPRAPAGIPKRGGGAAPLSWEQRRLWFTTGYEQGTLQACDTFSASQL